MRPSTRGHSVWCPFKSLHLALSMHVPDLSVLNEDLNNFWQLILRTYEKFIIKTNNLLDEWRPENVTIF